MPGGLLVHIPSTSVATDWQSSPVCATYVPQVTCQQLARTHGGQAQYLSCKFVSRRVSHGKCITGLEAELKHQEEVSASQAAEVTVLKDAAAASKASCRAQAEELQHAQSQASQLTAEHERLQQTCNVQIARCNQLEENLTGSSDRVSELQRQLQTETEALHAVQAELQGTV